MKSRLPPSKQVEDDGYETEESDSETESKVKTGESAPYLSRGQRKRQERKDAWLRKNDFQSYVKKARETTFDDFKMGAVKDTLAELRQKVIDEQSAEKEKKKNPNANGLTRKQREMQLKKEAAQFNAIANFDLFKSNPFGALGAHLTNSLPANEEPKKDKKAAPKK